MKTMLAKVKKVKMLTVCMLVMLAAFMLLGSDAQAETVRYKVRFGKIRAGEFVNSYPDYTKKVAENTVIELPSRKYADTVCYWVDQSTKRVYSCKAKFKVTRNTWFTIRWYPKKYAKFVDPDTNKEMTELRKTYAISQHAKMQSFPKTNPKYKKFLGWSRIRGAKFPSYLPGETVRMYETTKFYAVYGATSTKKKQIVLYDNAGNEYKRMDVASGLKFPSVDLKNDYTCIGWSTRPKKKAAPEYLEDETIPAREGAYYMVIRKPSNDPSSGVKGLRKPVNHSMVYLIGDSRTAFMKYEFGANPAKTVLLGNSGAGYAWLEGTDPRRATCAYDLLLKQLKKNRLTAKGKNPAVIFNLGVNDMGNISKYIAFYKKIAPTLKKVYHCDLYIMSVNPSVRELHKRILHMYYGHPEDVVVVKTMPKIKEFNTRIKSGLDGMYQYIDTYSYLIYTGWTSWGNSDFRGYWEPDGLHYSETTYEKIYNYAVKMTDQV